ncbi:uncharacterized protein N7515_008289 [Penicillium bovifimosum]|uniref:Uncharacterized protein n=1 Tax=Penicillium bovifimosum TaxID=126998 RepID=A0A9W9KW80_9EURO|nr:uncharacterized protein N7515_008289 [Penicillium bovifimosum]KAJ5124464.1 hypothetical protein N7515_008289 [Penicillium bovifimosum]
MSHPLEPNLSPKVSPEPSLTMITTCANKFVDQLDFESHVRDTIQCASNPQMLVFENVSSSWGEQTVDSINQTRDGYSTRKNYNSCTKVLRIRIMPTVLHDCVQTWWRVSEISLRDTGDLTGYEQTQIETLVGTTLEFRSGPYSCSRKEPDFFIRTNNDLLPSLVMESGWSESWNHLMDDMDLLLVGGDGAISAVVILKWQLHPRTRLVSGFVDLYVRDRNGMPVRRQREDVFPIPPQTPTSQRLNLTRREVFGRHLLPDPTRNGPPNAMVYLEIDQLRLVATRALQRMSLLPA